MSIRLDVRVLMIYRMEGKPPLVSIIILNYNAGDLLTECIESIANSNYTNYEIILVDNASQDQSHKMCKQKFPQISLIENKENVGYCEGNNVGIRKANGEFLVILNPDTIVEKNCLEELIKAYHNFGEALYQPKLLAMDDRSRINTAGNMIQIFGFGYSRGKGENDIHQYDQPQQIGYASGACLFVSRQTLEKVGYFDSFLFAYHDDLDLGWRALKMRINSYYIPSAVVYHKESHGFKWGRKKFYLLERNRHYCLKVHYSKETIRKILPYLVSVEIVIFFFYLSKGLLREKISGYFDIVRNRKYIELKHKESEERRKMEDSEIIKKFTDQLYVPQEVGGVFMSKYFNKFLSLMGRLARDSIQH